MKFDKNDPQLTAFILGELSAEEADRLQQKMITDPELAQFVEELRRLATQLQEDLKPSESMQLAPEQRARILQQAERGKSLNQQISLWIGSRWIWSLSSGGLLAAGVAFLVFRSGLVPIDSPPTPFGSGVQSPAITAHDAPPAKAAPPGTLKIADREPPSAPRAETLFRDAPAAKSLAQPARPEPQGMGRLLGTMGAHPSGAALKAQGRGKLSGWSQEGLVGQGGINSNSFAPFQPNQFLSSTSQPLSTFSVNVDTASYGLVRNFLSRGVRPPRDAVRTEELINYFSYSYSEPESGPFRTHTELTYAPWNKENYLLRVGIQGKRVDMKDRAPSNLVFLIDVSGSMAPANRLPLVKKSLELLIEQLDERDRIAIVVYAGESNLALPSTALKNKERILETIHQLRASGSTNAGDGIQQAYRIATENFIKGGNNRVILASDGDFNVGVTSQEELTELIQKKAKSGVYLTILGFGMGNLKDSRLELLSREGNGNYAYIDSEREAKKVFVDQVTGTLITIARDVKVQIEFNPAQVESYRLIGYENRVLTKEDFINDDKSAGDIGAGHSVTALYEIVPRGSQGSQPVDPLRYQTGPSVSPELANELLTVKVRYKHPEGVESQPLEFTVGSKAADFASSSKDFKFQAAVAGFGMLLRGSEFKGSTTWDSVKSWAEQGLGADEDGLRREFMNLLDQAAQVERPELRPRPRPRLCQGRCD